MKAYTLGARGLTESANQFKEEFLEKMVKAKVITKEKADEMNTYSIVLAEKGFFGSIWDKLHWKNKDDTDFKIVIVKHVE